MLAGSWQEAGKQLAGSWQEAARTEMRVSAPAVKVTRPRLMKPHMVCVAEQQQQKRFLQFLAGGVSQESVSQSVSQTRVSF